MLTAHCAHNSPIVSPRIAATAPFLINVFPPGLFSLPIYREAILVSLKKILLPQSHQGQTKAVLL